MLKAVWTGPDATIYRRTVGSQMQQVFAGAKWKVGAYGFWIHDEPHT